MTVIWHHFCMVSSAAIIVVVVGVVIEPGQMSSKSAMGVNLKCYHIGSVERSADECPVNIS